jgi:hypothetical protein
MREICNKADPPPLIPTFINVFIALRKLLLNYGRSSETHPPINAPVMYVCDADITLMLLKMICGLHCALYCDTNAKEHSNELVQRFCFKPEGRGFET